jgi:hypothetical protein
VMFKWIISDFFLKRQGLFLPTSTQQAHSKQASTDKFLLQTGEEIHPDYATDTTRTHYTTQYDKS